MRETSDWSGAVRIALDGPPAKMTDAHLRRARVFVIAYIALAVVSVILALVVRASPAVLIAMIVVALLLVASTVRAAITGRLAAWSAPLQALSVADRRLVLRAMFTGIRLESGQNDELAWLLADRFLYGTRARTLNSALMAALLAALGVAALGLSVAFGVILVVGGALSLLAGIAEAVRARQVRESRRLILGD